MPLILPPWTGTVENLPSGKDPAVPLYLATVQRSRAQVADSFMGAPPPMIFVPDALLYYRTVTQMTHEVSEDFQWRNPESGAPPWCPSGKMNNAFMLRSNAAKEFKKEHVVNKFGATLWATLWPGASPPRMLVSSFVDTDITDNIPCSPTVLEQMVNTISGDLPAHCMV